MPTPDRTSLDAIVQAGRDILESAGVSGLTMQAVAERVGVRAPSLYKRVRNRDELVRLVVEATVRDLGERLEEVGSSAAPGHDRLGGDVHGSGSRTRGSGSGPESSGSDPRSELVELARAFRDFAHARPVASQLIFAPKTDEASPAVGELAKAVAPVLRVTATLAGEQHALQAARTFTAWAYGFITMELAGAFQLGGDVGDAFEFGISRLTDALDSR